MRTLWAALVLCATGCGVASSPAPVTPPTPPLPPVTQPSAYVSPFVGSGGFGFAFGSAFPGALSPNGLAKVGPDTTGPYGTINFLHYSGYWYGDNAVQGFSHLHLHGTGATDYGVLTLMPTDGFDATRTVPSGYQSTFQKASESATPGYYAVTLDRGGIQVELTATPHAAHHRYTFSPKAAAHDVILDLNHTLNSGTISGAQVTLDQAGQTLSGKLHSLGGMSSGYGGYDVFFAIRTRQPWTASQVWSSGVAPAPGTQAQGTGVGVVLTFDKTSLDPVEVQVGLSLVSTDNAAANLAAEMPAWTFDATHQKVAATWDSLLSAILVSGGTADQRTIFYSALYHAFLMPSIQSDLDGSYHGDDGMTHQASGFHFMSDMSLWDTYRTLNPLYTLITPNLSLDFVQSLYAMAQQRGSFPKWPLAGGDSGTMIGDSAELVLTDAYLKGVQGFDAQGAYAMFRAAALDPVTPAGGRGGRDQIVPYMMLGYVPASVGGSVSLTTEYGREDLALGNLAAALGQSSDSTTLLNRALGYRKLYNPATGFLQQRNADGSFPDVNPDPTCFCDSFVEADAWQSLWMPSYDLPGLTTLLGGGAALVNKLDALFTQTVNYYANQGANQLLDNARQPPYYWAGNEPDIHAGYLFAQMGRPDLTQKWVRWAMTTRYGSGADGLPGNDDGGTTSSWYVWSALGIYPLVGTDQYVLGSPLFTEAKIAVPGGVFTIVADGASADNLYVQSVTLDGAALQSPTLAHKDLQAGRTLHFVMGPSPGPWGMQ